MLTEEQNEALRKWYRQTHVAARTQKLVGSGRLAELEDWIQKECLFPIGRVEALPDFMKDEDGETLFPSNLNPRIDQEGWQDAVGIGWEVVEQDHGISQQDYQKQVDKIAADDWQAFLDSVEERKRQRRQEGEDE